ncbi:unnamed protein product [Chrysoparadoxa australica]
MRAEASDTVELGAYILSPYGTGVVVDKSVRAVGGVTYTLRLWGLRGAGSAIAYINQSTALEKIPAAEAKYPIAAVMPLVERIADHSTALVKKGARAAREGNLDTLNNMINGDDLKKKGLEAVEATRVLEETEGGKVLREGGEKLAGALAREGTKEQLANIRTNGQELFERLRASNSPAHNKGQEILSKVG